MIVFFYQRQKASNSRRYVERRREIEAQWSHQNQLIRLSRLGIHDQLSGTEDPGNDGNWLQVMSTYGGFQLVRYPQSSS